MGPLRDYARQDSTQPAVSPGKTGKPRSSKASRAAFSGASSDDDHDADSQLAEIMAAWPTLSATQRAKLVAIARDAGC